MKLLGQQEALDSLKVLVQHRQHGVLIVGAPGTGKTYAARQYAQMLNISDFYIINPVVADLKSMIDGCVKNGTSVVICIEDLDSGVVQAAYPLLKLIEDCPSYIYVVVTCSNLAAIPDTIPSRCALVTVNPPTRSDLSQYAKFRNAEAYEVIGDHKIWSCVKSMSDVDTVMKFTSDQLRYFNNLPTVLMSKDSVSNISWKLTHFEDNSEVPAVLALRFVLQDLTGAAKRACIACLNDLAESHLSQNAIISRFLFDIKYCRAEV